MEPISDDEMELKQVHLMRVLQMPGGTTELLQSGEKNGTETKLTLEKDMVKVVRDVEGVVYTRYIPLSAVQFLETVEDSKIVEDGRKSQKAGAAGSSKRSAVEQGAKASSRGGNKKKAG